MESPAPMGTGAGLGVGTSPLGGAVRSREFNAVNTGRFPVGERAS